MAVPAIVSRAQRSSLFGIAGDMERDYTPYKRAFGETSDAYDLNTPGAVAEVKAALRALAQAGSATLDNPAPIIETFWKAIGDDDTWDAVTALEFVLFVSRNKDIGLLTVGPYTQQPTYPSMPQPAVMGLELLAGVVNERLKGVPALKIYEGWRGGMMKPPGPMGKPTPDTPVTPTVNIEPRTTLPADAPQKYVDMVKASEVELNAATSAAYNAKNEIDRDAAAHNAIAALKSRSNAMLAASKESTAQRQLEHQCVEDGGIYDYARQTCVIKKRPDQPPPQDRPPSDSGSVAPWVVGGLVLLGLGFAAYKYQHKPR